MRLALVMLLASACGDASDPPADGAGDAAMCDPTVVMACTPTTAVCWSGMRTCATPCNPVEPVDMPCGTGVCQAGVCVGPTTDTIANPVAGAGQFGAGVATDGQRIAVGAPGDHRAYILDVDPRGGAGTFVVSHTLGSIFGEAGSGFGAAMAIEGGLAVVGAPRSTGPGAPADDAGAVVLYARDEVGDAWRELAQVVGPDGGEFGAALALDGTRVLAGAPRAGAAYILDRTGARRWTVTARLAADGTGRFGHAVDVQGERAIVGAPGTATAYVFDHATEGWMLVATLHGDPGTAFGASVALFGDRAIVGAPGYADPGGTATGAAYIVERDRTGTWQTVATLHAATPHTNGRFGRSVTLDDGRAVVTELDRDAGAGITSVFRRQGDGRWLETARQTDDGSGDPPFVVGGIEADAQVAVSRGVVVVGYPAHAAGVVIVREISGL